MTDIENLAAGVQAFTSNVFLVTGERTALVDTGANFDVVGAAESRVDDLDTVVLTHTHRDHVGNVDAVRSTFDVETVGYDPSHPAVDTELGETVQVGDHDFTVLHTPGHKDDHVCLYAPAAKVCFAGDLVFADGAFGRTDLEEGDRETLIRSIDALLDLVDPDLVALHTGHGPSVTDGAYETIERAGQAARRF
ncbi:MBL fold metallo-hydrolase [Haloplanus aerogenes]|uniref:Glyoxylase-like metal-dependent hydrolase (Beta-lactamase superfamily II) n=1 Tax=Haloplanus aerogenes TaxID=660522 RepID=A0A3M0DSW5_9EURY|nr:MBL fold metallo-hydrolase [Haloplanus aerogenes]AZH25429.1 MBL fold metallo-hydrolase [Haloplanus aerogenes]RMB25141.1 glyoxylase-like metal-dependent hydrolase (beta-lactamase superfamily II) [Haloplanus aerogenes]